MTFSLWTWSSNCARLPWSKHSVSWCISCAIWIMLIVTECRSREMFPWFGSSLLPWTKLSQLDCKIILMQEVLNLKSARSSCINIRKLARQKIELSRDGQPDFSRDFHFKFSSSSMICLETSRAMEKSFRGWKINSKACSENKLVLSSAIAVIYSWMLAEFNLGFAPVLYEKWGRFFLQHRHHDPTVKTEWVVFIIRGESLTKATEKFPEIQLHKREQKSFWIF